jgi:hypothetical protein
MEISARFARAGDRWRERVSAEKPGAPVGILSPISVLRSSIAISMSASVAAKLSATHYATNPQGS